MASPPAPQIRIHTDGASRGNPGPSACSFVLAVDGQLPVEHAERLPNTTNNIAEYTAVVRALARALELNPARVAVFSDSELMVKQVTGVYAVKNADIRELYTEVRNLMRQLGVEVTFTHVRREQNRRADELCNAMLDGKWSAPPVRIPAPAPSNNGVATADDETAPIPAPLEAMTFLRSVCLAHATDLANAPSVEAIWTGLARILDTHGLLKKPRSKRPTGTT